MLMLPLPLLLSLKIFFIFENFNIFYIFHLFLLYLPQLLLLTPPVPPLPSPNLCSLLKFINPLTPICTIHIFLVWDYPLESDRSIRSYTFKANWLFSPQKPSTVPSSFIGGWEFTSNSHSMLERWVAWYRAALYSQRELLWVQGYSGPVTSRGHCFVPVLPDLSFLNSFRPIFRSGLWARTNIYSLHFGPLWISLLTASTTQRNCSGEVWELHLNLCVEI